MNSAAALKDASQTKFCAVGVTEDKRQFGLSKTSPAFPDLYKKGKFWITVPSLPSGSEVSSEFYDDADEAVRALTDRGVVVFRTCPKPLPR